MKLAITQPNYLPWLGFFDLLDETDLWVVLDNVQLSKQSFQVRNRVKAPDDSVTWLTVSTRSCPLRTLLNAVRLADSDWPLRHWRKIEDRYRRAAHFDELAPFLGDLLSPREDESTLARYNARVVRELCGVLGLAVETRVASDLVPELQGTAEEKVLALCKVVGPTSYYNSRRGVEAGLYRPEAFADAGLRLFKQDYQHPTYRQQGHTFRSHLSVVDLLLNEGSAALSCLRQGRRWVEMT